MSEASVLPAGAGDEVALADVERALAQRVKALQDGGDKPVMRACMSNLVIYCDRPAVAEMAAVAVPDIVAVHPARVLLLLGEPDAQPAELTARVTVQPCPGSGRRLCSEQVTLHATGANVHRLPFAVRSLVVGDLPTNLWWAAPLPPPFGGVLFHDLSENAEQVVYDSIGWPEPARGVVAVAAWLAQLDRGPRTGRWRVASDLNWRRLKGWRRLLTQATDPASAPGLIEGISDVALEHGPHAVVQAWELVSWLAARLGWRLEASRVQPGVEISWNFDGPQGPVRVRLRRLEQGPARIEALHLTSLVGGKPTGIDLVVQDEYRLAAVPTAGDTAPRTVAVSAQPLAELVGRQLSDRERDRVFRESMALARVLAESVLDHS